MKHLISCLLVALSAVAANAEPTVKYAGGFEFSANFMHKEAVTGAWTLTLDGEALTQVFMKPTQKVVGIAEFASTEQALFSKVSGTAAEIAVIYKLKGPTHRWHYVYVGQTADAGKTYAGQFYKVDGTVESIKSVFDSGDLSAWKNVGHGTLNQN